MRKEAEQNMRSLLLLQKSPSNFPQSLYCKRLSLRVHAQAGKYNQGKEHTQQYCTTTLQDSEDFRHHFLGNDINQIIFSHHISLTQVLQADDAEYLL